jgi:hypothetical protein
MPVQFTKAGGEGGGSCLGANHIRLMSGLRSQEEHLVRSLLFFRRPPLAADGRSGMSPIPKCRGQSQHSWPSPRYTHWALLLPL